MTEQATKSLLAEHTRRLEEIPPMAALAAWRPATLEEGIERTRLIGKRVALERLIRAQREALETMRERERSTKAREACEQ